MKPFVAFWVEAIEVSHKWAGGLNITAKYVLTERHRFVRKGKQKSHWEQDTRVRLGRSPSPPFDSEETEVRPGLRRERCCFFGGRRWDFR